MVNKPTDQIEPIFNGPHIHQWGRKVSRQQARARARDCPVNCIKQTSRPASASCADKLQTVARRCIDQHMVAGLQSYRRRQEGQTAFPDMIQIGQQACGGG